MRCTNLLSAIVFVAAALALLPQTSKACGGFFCTTLPINQAGEQIVFRQQGDEITAMVRILYSGEAEDFSWVVPVPTVPDISLGSDITFNELELSTRPQFNLQQEGQVCEKDQFVFAASENAPTADLDSSDGGVTIEEQLSVGAFEIDIVSSDNADDMAIWLEENNYLLTDRGRDLIEPYVLAGMKFVALKLRSGEQTGSIQPLIMKYESSKPMVPIRLTAIAAEDDMGVLVWVVNDARAIPENYEHVIPNYSKLDWYSGQFNAYNSYLALITDAMNEAGGGQGFATDYAGAITSNIRDSLTQTSDIQQFVNTLDNIVDNAEYISASLFQSNDFSGTLALLQTLLPLSDGLTTNIYSDPDAMRAVFTTDELSAARLALRAAIIERQLEPITNGVELLTQGAYMTRLYTTLSANEMTVDPVFAYNAQMPEQSIVREALLQASCTNNVSQWSLTLGQGTGREGEVVISAIDQPIPFFSVPVALDDQPAAFARQRTSGDAAPELLFEATASTIDIGADGSVSGGSITSASTSSDDGFLGAYGPIMLLIGSSLLFTRNYRRTRIDT